MNLFWDTCVLTALLNGREDECDLPSIQQFVADSGKGECKFYISKLTIAEILPSQIKHLQYGTFEQFLNDLDGAVIPVPPDPNIMSLAARIRDIPYSKKVNKDETATRGMDVPDAVLLATAIVLDAGWGVPISGFHTFDNGKKRSVNGGKCVPLLDYATWCDTLKDTHASLADKVIRLNRCHPTHPNPTLPGIPS